MNARYGRRHRAIRAAMLPYAEGKPCVRCGLPIEKGQAVDLDHNDDGQTYRGLAHQSCNRRAGAERGHLLRQARRHAVMKLEQVALGVEISNDRTHTSVAAAARDGDRVAVVLLEYLDGTDTAATVAEIAGKAVDLLGVVVDPRSPAATLVEPLTALGVDLVSPNTHDIAVAHGGQIPRRNGPANRDAYSGRIHVGGHRGADVDAHQYQ